MRAVVVAGRKPSRLTIQAVPDPQPAHSEALIRVAAISLNRGEVRMARELASDGFRPGWDFAGTIAMPAQDGSTPPAGTRVVGMLPTGAWSELVPAPAGAIAALPDSIAFDRAATLPVAGLTALLALRRNPAARNVLITGASGGVGIFAAQLARNAGATVAAVIRNEQHAAVMRRLGANNLAVGGIDAARAFAPYDLILESVGGEILGAALGMLAPDGMCVLVGATAGSITTFDAKQFRVGGSSLYGFVLGHELRREPPSAALAHLAALVAGGRLDPLISLRARWENICEVADDLMARRFPGKAVLHVAN